MCEVGTSQDNYEFPAIGLVAIFIDSINMFQGQNTAKGQMFVGFFAPGLGQVLTAASDRALPPPAPACRPRSGSSRSRCRRRASSGTTFYRAVGGRADLFGKGHALPGAAARAGVRQFPECRARKTMTPTTITIKQNHQSTIKKIPKSRAQEQFQRNSSLNHYKALRCKCESRRQFSKHLSNECVA